MLKFSGVATYGIQTFESSTVPDISYIQDVQLKSKPAHSCSAACQQRLVYRSQFMITLEAEQWGNTEWIEMCGGKNCWKTFAWKKERKCEDDCRWTSES